MNLKVELKQRNRYDIVKILSSQQRDYLVRNNGDQVKIESLRGKIVVLYIEKLCPTLISSDTTQNMIEAYNQLAIRGDIEIVFVGTQNSNNGEDKDVFDKCFSKMPWLAIPYFDLDTRMRFDVQPFSYGGVFLDKDGTVLKTRADHFFRDFGARCYPFTKERVKVLMYEVDETCEEKTVKSYLSSPSRNYVISCTKEKIPISELEEKIVGLYFYKRNKYSVETLTPKLVEIYQELKCRGENFEIVMVNLHFIEGYDDDEQLFEDDFKRMPWLALPFMDQTCRKLYQIYRGSFDLGNRECGLVIIGPGGNIYNDDAFPVVLKQGIQAYPFSLETLVEMEISILQAFTFDSLLIGMGLNVVYAKNGAQIKISDLSGVGILLFIGQYGSFDCCRLLQKLLNWHNKSGEKRFQVIFASRDKDLSSFNNFYKEMPWLTLPFDPRKTKSLEEALGVTGSTALVAFGTDGRILTTNGVIIVDDESCSATVDDCEIYESWFERVHGKIMSAVRMEEVAYFIDNHDYEDCEFDTDYYVDDYFDDDNRYVVDMAENENWQADELALVSY